MESRVRMVCVKELSIIVLNYLNKFIFSISLRRRYIILNIDVVYLKEILLFLKNHKNFLYDSLLDLWCVDYIIGNRFELNYMLNSSIYCDRIWLKFRVSKEVLVESIESIYSSSSWLEREVWDMYGVFFKGHNDLRRILSDYGYKGYPLRKDFPLSGFKELRYDDTLSSVIEEKVELSQKYRYYRYNR